MISRDSDATLKASVARPWPWLPALNAPPESVLLGLVCLRPLIRLAHRRPTLTLGRRMIVDHELILVESGRADVLVEGMLHRLEPGDVLYLQPFCDHRIIDLGDAASRHVAVHFDWAPDLPEPLARQPYRIEPEGWRHPPVRLPENRGLAAAIRACAQAFRADDPWAGWTASRRLAEGLAAVLAQEQQVNAAGDPRLASVLARLSDHLAHPWDAEAIARLAGLSPSHCRAWFRAGLGFSPLEWLRRARIDRARALLTDTSLPVQDIAGLVGFPDALHFSRVFRRLHGCAPSRLRG